MIECFGMDIHVCGLLCATRGDADGAGEWRSGEGGGRASVYALQHSQDTPEQVKAHTLLNLPIDLVLYH